MVNTKPPEHEKFLVPDPLPNLEGNRNGINSPEIFPKLNPNTYLFLNKLLEIAINQELLFSQPVHITIPKEGVIPARKLYKDYLSATGFSLVIDVLERLVIPPETEELQDIPDYKRIRRNQPRVVIRRDIDPLISTITRINQTTGQTTIEEDGRNWQSTWITFNQGDSEIIVKVDPRHTKKYQIGKKEHLPLRNLSRDKARETLEITGKSPEDQKAIIDSLSEEYPSFSVTNNQNSAKFMTIFSPSEILCILRNGNNSQVTRVNYNQFPGFNKKPDDSEQCETYIQTRIQAIANELADKVRIAA